MIEEQDIVNEVLRTVNRPEDDEYWVKPVQKFVEESISRLLIKLDFELFNQVVSFEAVNTWDDRVDTIDLSNSFKRVELVTDKYGKEWRMMPVASMSNDLYLESYRKFPEYTIAKRGLKLILPPRFNNVFYVQGYLNLTSSRVQTGYKEEFLPAAHDYIYYDAVDRMYMFLQEDTDIIQLNRTMRDSAFLDVETWNAGFKSVGTIQIFG
jgi:hypothetical protein|nr:MAG TPA: hypothetical protein [Caudoviricetes sp.]